MKVWMSVALALAVLVIGGLLGRQFWPRQVVVVVKKPAIVQSHTVTFTDSGPMAVLKDSVAKLLVKLHVPVPPRPSLDQPQLIYGLSYIGRQLTMSTVRNVEPRYGQETWTDIDENFVAIWRDTGALWDVTCWPNGPGTPTVQHAASKPWKPWRLTASATLGWFPGEAAYIEANPGVLLLGHLAVGPTVRWNFADLRSGKLQTLRVGGRISLSW